MYFGRTTTSAPSDFYLEVAKGNVPGHSAINKFGHNATITTASDPEDIWTGGGLYAFFPTTAQSMEILSSSTNDTSGGTGARTVIVYGLDSNWDEQSETLTLNGTTPVNLVNTYIRMFRAVVLTAGSVETNDGNLTVRIQGGGTTAIFIAADDGQTQQAIYTIPNGKSGYFIKGYVGISESGGAFSGDESAVFKWKARPNNGTDGAWQTKGQIESLNRGDSTWQYAYGIPAGPLPGKTDIRLECTEVTTTMGVVGGFDIVLVDD